MANYTYFDLLNMDPERLASFGFIRNDQGGISKIRAGVATDTPPTLTQRGEIEPMNVNILKEDTSVQVSPAGSPQQPCGSCREKKLAAEPSTIEGLKKMAENGRALLNGEMTTGLSSMLRAKIGGKVDARTQKTRASICSSCLETNTETGERLFREIDGVPYCGVPRLKAVIRDEKVSGCGCDLSNKVLYHSAACPRDKWGVGPIIGSSAHVIRHVKERVVLPDTIDVRSRTKDASDYTGIGDVLAAIPIVHAIAIEKSKRVRYRVLGSRINWALLGWPDVCVDSTETDIGDEVIDLNEFGAFELDRKLEVDGRNRHQYWFDVAKVKPFKPKLEVNQDGKSWATEQFSTARREGKKIVVVSPFANAPARQWPLHHWVVLVEKLQKAGLHAVMIDSDPQRGRFIPCQRYWGWSPTHISALIASSDLFVGNDSGMTHLAGLFDVNSLAICAATHGSTVFGGYPSIEVIQATGSCNGCLWREERGHERGCLVTCTEMWNIAPSTVAEKCLTKL